MPKRLEMPPIGIGEAPGKEQTYSRGGFCDLAARRRRHAFAVVIETASPEAAQPFRIVKEVFRLNGEASSQPLFR